LLLGGLGASGVLASGEVYAKPFNVAYAELSSTVVPPAAYSMLGGSDCEVRRTANKIEWHFVRGGEDLAVFTAKLSPEDATHTRVKVDFEVGSAMDEQSGKLIATPFMTNSAKLAMAEQVSAELEDRPFNRLRFGKLLAEHYQANPAELQGYGKAVRQIMIDNANTIRANSEGMNQPPLVTQPSTEAATQPSTVLPSN
jgi:hypothetical protein